MDHRADEYWSPMRSLAFLAAIFAIVFGSLLPSAVAASPATGAPIQLCSGDVLVVVPDADGVPRPATPDAPPSLKCASCVLSALTTLPPPPVVAALTPPSPAPAVRRTPVGSTAPTPAAAGRVRPPSTAPPEA